MVGQQLSQTNEKCYSVWCDHFYHYFTDLNTAIIVSGSNSLHSSGLCSAVNPYFCDCCICSQSLCSLALSSWTSATVPPLLQYRRVWSDSRYLKLCINLLLQYQPLQWPATTWLLPRINQSQPAAPAQRTGWMRACNFRSIKIGHPFII